MDLLALQGIEDTPIFTRNRVSNLKEQVEVVAMEAEWLDEETILRKLPNVTPDEVAEILARKDAEAADRMPPCRQPCRRTPRGSPRAKGKARSSAWATRRTTSQSAR